MCERHCREYDDSDGNGYDELVFDGFPLPMMGLKAAWAQLV
jgi:hypothetical protein